MNGCDMHAHAERIRDGLEVIAEGTTDQDATRMRALRDLLDASTVASVLHMLACAADAVADLEDDDAYIFRSDAQSLMSMARRFGWCQ